MKRIILLIASFLLLAGCSSGPILISIPNAQKERPPEGKVVVVSESACGYLLLDFLSVRTIVWHGPSLRFSTKRTENSWKSWM